MTYEFKDETSLCEYLEKRYNGVYLRSSTLPLPFCADKPRVKAIVLGTDPSNPRRIPVQQVFDLGNAESPFFRPILNNLHQIGLALEEVYVQNLCKNYFRQATSANANWVRIAGLWRGLIKQELDGLFDRRIPVLITAWPLYLALALNPIIEKPSDLYRMQVAVKPAENYLGRTIIPFFRHWFYNLEKWDAYREWVKGLI